MKKKTTTEPKVKRPVGRPKKIQNEKVDKNLLLKHIKELQEHVIEIEYQNIGLRSVISYLETQLGLTQTQ